jgi:uncharacterized membrane protein (Fun14 family)
MGEFKKMFDKPSIIAITKGILIGFILGLVIGYWTNIAIAPLLCATGLGLYFYFRHKNNKKR